MYLLLLDQQQRSLKSKKNFIVVQKQVYYFAEYFHLTRHQLNAYFDDRKDMTKNSNMNYIRICHKIDTFCNENSYLIVSSHDTLNLKIICK